MMIIRNGTMLLYNILEPIGSSLPKHSLECLALADFSARAVASAAAAVNGLASLDELRSLRLLRR
jgi:hypothetical protein